LRYLRILSYVDEVARSGSIRKAAERLNVTASAVNRRIADLESELSVALFERRPRGMSLTAAGELFVRYLRDHAGEVERVLSQIEELKGLRRGTVRIACSQALAFDFLSRQIAQFRATHPSVTFDVKVVDHERAIAALSAYEADLVIVFRPAFMANFQPLMTLEQPLVVLMAETHPLAQRKQIRLRDCLPFPVALPERSLGSRQLLEDYLMRSGVSFNVAAESNSFEMLRGLVVNAGMLSFQLQIGAPMAAGGHGVIARDIDRRDVQRASLVFGRLRERNLPIATEVFAEMLVRNLERMRPAKS
jgi:DNA-binding transcriptional LysR family regulator